MRVAISLRCLEQPGGLGVVVGNLAARLLEIDSANDYLLLHRQASPPRLGDRHPHARRLRLRGPPGAGWDQLVLPVALGRLRADVLLCPGAMAPLASLTPCVLLATGIERLAVPSVFDRFDRLWFAAVMHVGARRARALIAPTASCARDLAGHLSIPASRIARIPFPPHERFRPAGAAERARVAARYDLPPRFILTLLAPSSPATVDVLLRAFGRVAPSVPHALVIARRAPAGATDPGTGETWAAAGDGSIRRHRFGPRVFDLGIVGEEDLPALYTVADLFVMPSVYDRFGIPLLEAMGCGCPVVASDAADDVVGGAALLADTHDVGQLEATIRRGLADPVLRTRLREHGLARASDRSWEATARAVLQVLRRAGSRELPAPDAEERAA